MDSEVDYDELGNILSSQGRSYSYDKDFRLTEIVSAEATINYESYDAAGRLERRTYDPAAEGEPNQTTTISYDDSGKTASIIAPTPSTDDDPDLTKPHFFSYAADGSLALDRSEATERLLLGQTELTRPLPGEEDERPTVLASTIAGNGGPVARVTSKLEPGESSPRSA